LVTIASRYIKKRILQVFYMPKPQQMRPSALHGKTTTDRCAPSALHAKPPPMCPGAIVVPSLRRVGLDKETRQGRRGEGIGVYGGVYSINELN
jgi:hypothetical protein